ncbi:MAG: Chromosome partition protein Smc [Planctomycetota bacterium]|jgi:hypothetical protein
MNRQNRLWLIVPAVCFLGFGSLAEGQAPEANPAATSPAPVAEPPLHQRIDALLLPGQEGLGIAEVAPAPLIRRLYLDLIGVPPTLAQLQNYLADPAPEKYSNLVSQLLKSPEFVEHWVKQLDLMLMERRANSHVPQEAWEDFLRSSLASGQPFHQLCASILAADGRPGPARPSARFYLDRAGDPNLITRDVGRIFFGRDLQCAQCHDHPLIDSYYQSDFQGIAAFFSGGYMVEVADGDKKVQVYGEKSIAESPFESVFHKGESHRSLPRIPGLPEIAPPSAEPGSDYEIAPAEGVAAKPKHSRRKQLADLTTSGAATAFSQNWANRFWSLIFGRGVIHPVDLIHAENDPVHPDLLPILGKALADSQFDLRSFLRELVMTRVYRSGQSDPWDRTDTAVLKQIVSQMDWKKRVTDSKAIWEQAKVEGDALAEQFENTKSELAAIEKERTALLTALDQAKAATLAAIDAANKVGVEVAASQKALADEQAKQAKLQAASTASAEVKTLLPQDAEVAKAAETLQQRLDASNAAITTLQNALQEKQKAHATALAAVEPPKMNWKVADQNVAAKQLQYAQIDQRTTLARETYERALMRAASLKKQMQLAEKMVVLGDSLQSIGASEAALAGYMTSRQQLATMMEGVNTALTGIDQQIAQTAKEKEQADEQVRVYGQRMTESLGKKKLLVDAVDSLAKVPESPSDVLKAAQQELTQRIQQADAQMSELTKQSQVAQEAAVAVQGRLADMQKNRVVQVESLSKIKMQQQELDANVAKVEQQRLASVGLSGRTLEEIREQRRQRFEYSKLVALSPEQFAWSLLSVTGFVERQVAARVADLDKNSPLTEEQKKDEALLNQRRIQTYLQARKELQGNVNVFVSLYGAGPGQPQGDFFATADQALFANNGGVIYSWAGANSDNVTAKLANTQDIAEGAKILYLAVLGREPTAIEIEELSQYLNQAPDKRAALAQEVVWSLLTSAEFRFNH